MTTLGKARGNPTKGAIGTSMQAKKLTRKQQRVRRKWLAAQAARRVKKMKRRMVVSAMFDATPRLVKPAQS